MLDLPKQNLFNQHRRILRLILRAKRTQCGSKRWSTKTKNNNPTIHFLEKQKINRAFTNCNTTNSSFGSHADVAFFFVSQICFRDAHLCRKFLIRVIGVSGTSEILMFPVEVLLPSGRSFVAVSRNFRCSCMQPRRQIHLSARLISCIHHTCDFKHFCHVRNTGFCFTTPILQEILRIRKLYRVERCAFGSHTFFRWVGCARKNQVRTVQQNQKSFPWM